MFPLNRLSSRLLVYPTIVLVLAACGAASPVAVAPAASSASQAAVTATAIMPSATPTDVPSSTVAPTGTAAPTMTATVAPASTMAAVTVTVAPAPTAPSATATPMPAAAAPAATGAKVAAQIKLFQFKANPLEIKAGTTVEWTNEDAIEHSVTSGTPPTPSGAFDSDFFTQGKSFSFTFTKPGTYTYFCKRHNSMTGTITVTAP